MSSAEVGPQDVHVIVISARKHVAVRAAEREKDSILCIEGWELFKLIWVDPGRLVGRGSTRTRITAACVRGADKIVSVQCTEHLCMQNLVGFVIQHLLTSCYS